MLKVSTAKSPLYYKLKKLHGKQVNIGIVGEPDSKLLMVAAVNEYGANIEITPKMRKFLHMTGLHVKKETTHIVIPERSFIRSTFDDKKYFKELQAKLEPVFARVLNDEADPEILLDSIGLLYQSFVKRTLRSIKSPENHPFTIHGSPKGTDKRFAVKGKGQGKGLLYNTGTLLRSINYEVKG